MAGSWFERDAESPGTELGRVAPADSTIARPFPVACGQDGRVLAGEWVYGVKVHATGGPFDLSEVDTERAPLEVEVGIYAVPIVKRTPLRLVLAARHPTFRHSQVIDISRGPTTDVMAAFIAERERLQREAANARRDLDCAVAELDALTSAMSMGCVAVIDRGRART